MREVARRAVQELNAQTFWTQFSSRRAALYIDGMADSWPARSWTAAAVLAKVGRKRVKVMHSEHSIFGCAAATVGPANTHIMSFADAWKLIESPHSSHYYIMQQSAEAEFPELAKDLRRPTLLDQWRVIDVTNVWVSGKGCRTGLHYDRSENFLVQMHGRKCVWLMEPEQGVNLYPGTKPDDSHCSRVNFFAPDLASYPLFANSEREQIRIVLEPGDALYIPRLWWHAVESMDTSISVNVWWHSLI